MKGRRSRSGRARFSSETGGPCGSRPVTRLSVKKTPADIDDERLDASLEDQIRRLAAKAIPQRAGDVLVLRPEVWPAARAPRRCTDANAGLRRGQGRRRRRLRRGAVRRDARSGACWGCSRRTGPRTRTIGTCGAAAERHAAFGRRRERAGPGRVCAPRPATNGSWWSRPSVHTRRGSRQSWRRPCDVS